MKTKVIITTTAAAVAFGCAVASHGLVLVPVTVIEVYGEERVGWVDGTTIVELPNGRRIPLAGKLGQPGDRFSAKLERHFID